MASEKIMNNMQISSNINQVQMIITDSMIASERLKASGEERQF